MVTAGVYLLMRLSPILEYSSLGLSIVLWIGGISALLGAICGLLENDLKKIIAFSTTSQLGYMIVACGLSQYNLAIFHLLNHAFFKALLFLAAGAIIHSLNDEQDMRKMGNLIFYLPLSYIAIFIGSFSIMAFPFLTGFYSKDLILELLSLPYNFSHSFIYFLTLFAAFITAFYSIRTLLFTFFNISSVSSITFHIYESNIWISFPLILLSFFALFFGYLSHEIYIGFGSTFFNNSLFIHPNHHFILDSQFHFSLLNFIPLLSFLFLIFLIRTQFSKIYKFQFFINVSKYFPILNHFNLYYNWLYIMYIKLSILFYRYMDKGFLELFGPRGIINIIDFFSFKFELLSTSNILHYLFYIISSIILIYVVKEYSIIFLFLYLFIFFESNQLSLR
jgi:NADH-ubiquinone oxidoreductase chain 5